MHRFFTSSIDSLFLSEEESRHCIGSKRLRKDDLIELTDGKGNLIQAKITDPNPKKCGYQQLSKHTYTLSNPKTHIAIVPPKSNDRIEWFIEKVTEIGVSEISFIYSTHSERKKVRIDRLEKILISAIKQSKNPFLPIINDIMPFEEFLTKENGDTKLIAHLSNHTVSIKQLKQENSYTVLIGPEGGFSDNEFLLAKENGYSAISLGKNILRTETAGIIACQNIQFLHEN